MVDVNTKRKCIEDNCLKFPCFNFDSENKGIYCAQHKKEDMIDVKTKRKYVEENCLKQPCFNFDSENKFIYQVLFLLHNIFL